MESTNKAGLTPIQKVRKLNPHAIAPNGGLKSFSEQYGEYSLVKASLPGGLSDNARAKALEDYSPFVLSYNCAEFGVEEIEDRPLILTNAALRHVAAKHADDIGELVGHLDNLAAELAHNVIAYEDKEKDGHLVFVMSEFSKEGNRLTTAVRVDLARGPIELNSVRSVHGNSHIWDDMVKAAQRGRQFWPNERTGAWLRNGPHVGGSPAEDLSKRLLGLYLSREAEGWQSRAGLVVPCATSPSVSESLEHSAVPERAAAREALQEERPQGDGGRGDGGERLG